MVRRIVIYFFLSFIHAAFAQVNVTTYHNDNARTGQNLKESILRPANVSPSQFGRLFVKSVDGYIYAQPLYMSNVVIGGKSHNVVFVATEHNSVYAFDADSDLGLNKNPLWKVSFINPPAVTTLNSMNDLGCEDLVPEVGITGTPVIDPASDTLYVVARTKENGHFFQRLHALDITSGQEKFGGPVIINAVVSGTGGDHSGGIITFNPLRQNQRSGLLLKNGLVYITWGSHCDIFPYHGWIIAYEASTLRQAVVWNTTPNGELGGIWQGGAAPSSDATSIYLAVGNGTFDLNTGGRDAGNTILKLGRPSGGTLPVVSYFTPFNQEYLNNEDIDLGSGGPLVLPNLPISFAHPHLLTQVGKEGTIYLVDRDVLGGYDFRIDHIVQKLPNAVGGIWGMPAYWNNNVYYGGVNDALNVFSFNADGEGLLSTTPTSYSPENFSYPGTTPSISAKGSTNGIVWTIAYVGKQAVLYAYDATNLANELYQSSGGSRDAPGPAVKFSVPTVANGKVYVGTATQLAVYGHIRSASMPTFMPAGNVYTSRQFVTITSATADATIYYTRDGSFPTVHSILYTGPIIIDNTDTLRAIAVVPGMRSSQASTSIYTIKNFPGNNPSYQEGFSEQGLTFNGNASLNENRLQLTNKNNFMNAGSAFFNAKVSVQHFTSDFTFQLTDPKADGFTFCIQNNGSTVLGQVGGYLGYAPSIQSSVAVKFDLYSTNLRVG
ncbi:exported hypothetical protein [Gammaproteobacteria bacterium]